MQLCAEACSRHSQVIIRLREPMLLNSLFEQGRNDGRGMEHFMSMEAIEGRDIVHGIGLRHGAAE
jgi:hypothetical protein